MKQKLRVLMVCTGNICRSPTAEGVLLAFSDACEVDSAGTHSYHVGEPPDPRTLHAALVRGYDLSEQRARKVQLSDFEKFDWLLAMDRSHRDFLLQMARTPKERSQVRLLLDFSDRWPGEEVPDPYYDGPEAFEEVLNRVEDGCRGFLKAVLKK